jgi:nucleotide-binding universal stress UspA family protein
MIPKHVLVGYDGSAFADAAFEDALDLASVSQAGLSVVSVATPPEPPGEVETAAVLEAATRRDEFLLAGLTRRAEERGVALNARVLVGHPADQILKSAVTLGADLIVVGHRGHSAIRDWMFGSISRRIVAHAPCSVLVARPR